MKKGGKKNYKWWKICLVILAMCTWVFISVMASQIIIGNLLIWLVGAETLSKPVWTAIFSALVYILAMGLIVFIPPRLIKKVDLKTSRKELGLAGTPTWTDIGLAPVGFIVSLILAAGLVALFSLFPWFDAEEAQDVGFNLFMSGGDRIIAFLTLVVLAPIAEEVIFRGWLYGKMREYLHVRVPEKVGVAISMITVSALFGLVHMQWNVGINVFALSIVLCALREITGTVYAGILTHMIKNAVAFYLLYVIGIV